MHAELAWLALIADMLATACDPDVPEATRAELLTVACTWAVLRRNATGRGDGSRDMAGRPR